MSSTINLESAQVALWDGDTAQIRSVQFPSRNDSTLIEVAAAGICGTDRHVMEAGEIGSPESPISLGHEIFGRVLRVGSCTPVVGGGSLAEGDPVVVVPGIACGACSMCLSFGAHEHLCAHRIVHGFSAYSSDGFFPIGGYATHVELVDGVAVLPIPDDLPWQRAALGEMTAIAVRAVERALGQGRPDVGMGTVVGGTAAVLGLGPVGVAVSLVLRAAGLDVVGFERNAWRAKYAASELGIDVRSTDDRAAEWIEHTPNRLGFDVVVEAGGEPDLFSDALVIARPGGRVVELGNFVPVGTTAVDPSLICRKDLEVVGSVLAPPTSYPKALRLLRRDDLPFDRIVTHELSLDDLTDRTKLLGDSEQLKQVVRPHRPAS